MFAIKLHRKQAKNTPREWTRGVQQSRQADLSSFFLNEPKVNLDGGGRWVSVQFRYEEKQELETKSDEKCEMKKEGDSWISELTLKTVSRFGILSPVSSCWIWVGSWTTHKVRLFREQLVVAQVYALEAELLFAKWGHLLEEVMVLMKGNSTSPTFVSECIHM